MSCKTVKASIFRSEFPNNGILDVFVGRLFEKSPPPCPKNLLENYFIPCVPFLFYRRLHPTYWAPTLDMRPFRFFRGIERHSLPKDHTQRLTIGWGGQEGGGVESYARAYRFKPFPFLGEFFGYFLSLLTESNIKSKVTKNISLPQQHGGQRVCPLEPPHVSRETWGGVLPLCA